MTTSRRYTAAAVLTALLSLANIVVAVAVLPQGAKTVNSSSDQPPYVVLLVEILIGALGLAAAYGVWRRERWGVIATVALMIVNMLISLPGIPFGPTVFDKVSSVLGFLVGAVVIGLLVRRDRAAPVPLPAQR